MDVPHHWPTDHEDVVVRSFGDESRSADRIDQFGGFERHARVAHAQDVSQPLSIRLHRILILLRRREIPFPM
jgi:hypothetical protein